MLNDSADPLNCWDISDVIAAGMKHMVPKNDTYGALYFHIIPQLEEFSARLRTKDLSFTFLSVDACVLERVLKDTISLHNITSFDRIDVSNITDLCWLGLHGTLNSVGQLLKSRDENPHAALISLFLNYHVDAELYQPSSQVELMMRVLEAIRLLPTKTPPPRGDFDPVDVKLCSWSSNFTDFDKAWNIYQHSNLFAGIARGAGMRQRLSGYIVASRPFRIRRTGDRESMVEQLEKLSLSGLIGHEKYVEWVRVEPDVTGSSLVRAEHDEIGGSLIMGFFSYWPYILGVLFSLYLCGLFSN
jgi:hypothetical protein